ncbi:MAG: rhodanese-like domain-containing protein, partial [Cytophagales bacterium]
FGRGAKVNIAELLENGATILDVRSKSEFAGGHAKGAINIPLDQLPSQLGGFKKEEVIITCCASGMRSGSAKRIMNQAGFKNVHNGGSWYNVDR